MCGVRSFDIDEKSTIGDICAEYDSRFTQVVKVKDGVIHGIVASSTKVIDLIDDGYSYRVDQYKSSDCISETDKFNICIKFVGNSPAERQKTPILMKIANGNPLYTIGYHTASLMGLDLSDITNFGYSIDGKSMVKEQRLWKPPNPEFIPVVSLDMKVNKRLPPTHSYISCRGVPRKLM